MLHIISYIAYTVLYESTKNFAKLNGLPYTNLYEIPWYFAKFPDFVIRDFACKFKFHSDSEYTR
jgi:hypothetical protein